MLALASVRLCLPRSTATFHFNSEEILIFGGKIK
jgi:hypothetical protein